MNTSTFLPILGELFAKSALLLAGAMLVLAALKHVSAAHRHFIWCAAFVAVLLLPVTLVVRPAWAVPVIRITSAVPAEMPVRLIPESTDGGALIASNAPTPSPNPTWQWPDWRVSLTAIWAVGVGLVLLRRLVGSARLRLVRKATAICNDARLVRITRDTLASLAVSRSVEVRVSPEGCVPVTWGTLRPVLLMPVDALNWSEERLAAAVRHEVGHIARYDHLVRWISQFACALYWPNPLVWIAARGLRTEQEKAADDVVLTAGTDAEEYVGQLFDVARGIPSSSEAVTCCAVAMATPSTLEARMLAIVDEARDRRPLGRRAVTAGILVVALTLGISTGASLLGEDKVPTGADLQSPQLVEVESRFIEFKSPVADSEKALSFLIPEAGKPAVSLIPDEQFQAAVQALNQRVGTDLLTAPRITIRSGQDGSIEIVREFRYATEWDREGDVWTPKAYATRSVGTTLKLQAKILADGVIELNVEPSIVTFEGFKDLDSPEGKIYPPSGPGEKDELPTGHRLQAVFKERKASHQAKIPAGHTLVFVALPQVTSPSTAGEENVAGRQTAIFVKPVAVNAKGEPVAGPQLPSTSPRTGGGGLQGAPVGSQPGTGDDRLVPPVVNTPKGMIQPPIARAATSGPPAGLSAANGALPISPGIPVLGNVPIVGRLFESDGKTVGMAGSPSGGGLMGVGGIADDARIESAVPVPLDPGITATLEGPAGAAPSAENAPPPTAAKPRLSIKSQSMTMTAGGRGLATGNVEIDTGSIVIRTESAEIQPKGDAQAHPLDKVVVPKFQVTEVTLGEAVNRLLDAARAQGIEPGNVVVPKLPVEPRITMSLVNIPFFEALRYVTSLSNTKFTRVENGVVITPLDKPMPNPPTGAGAGTLPSSGPEARIETKPKRRVMISMVKNGDIRIENTAVQAGQLAEAIADLKRREPTLSVYIRAAGDVPYRDVESVMNALQSSGITDISFRPAP